MATFDVAAYGAVGDGVTNDTTAIQSAITAGATAGGGTLWFPRGTYLVDPDKIFIACGYTTWAGEGPDLSILKGASSGGQLVQATQVSPYVTIRDLGFDTSAGNISAFALYGTNTPRIRWINCKFTGFEWGGYGIGADRHAKIELINCDFHARGQGKGVAFEASEGIAGLRVFGCKFQYCANSIIIDTGSSLTPDEGHAEDIDISDSYFDGAWWLLAAYTAGSGGGVSYTANTLTDTGGSFGSVVQWDTIRVLASRRSGTVSDISELSLTDSSADFVSAGVMRGEIVRIGSVFGVVAGVESTTVLRVEEWLDATTYLPVTAPAISSSYTAFGITLGVVASVASTTITLYDRWFDLTGATATTPASGTLYEICVHPGYCGVQMEYGERRVRISNNTFKRSWADQVSVFGDDNIVINNVIEDGYDLGITCNGNTGRGHSIIANNRINHQGSGGIFCSGENILVTGNVITATTWTNSVNTVYLAGIIMGGVGGRVVGNIVDGQNQPLSRFGICVSNNDCTIADNTCKNVSVGGIQVYTSAAPLTNIKLFDNDSSIHYDGSSAMQDSGVLVGSADPTATVLAAAGTMYRRTGSGQLFVKTSDTSSNGWQLVPSTLSASVTWDPPSIADSAQTTTSLTVTGAALGDTVMISFSLSLQGLQLSAYVSAANTVTAVLFNKTGASVDLGSGTLRADVWHR